MDDWYVLHVLTGKELDVKGCLLKEGFKSLVPRRKLREQKDGKWHEIERLLFPSYVFVNTMMTDEKYYKVSEIPGVINILRGAANSPLPVPLEEMQVIFSFTKEGDLVGISDIFIDGETVRVISGALVGFEGLILKVDKRRFRAKVRFNFADQEKVVELGINVLDKI